MKDSKIKIHITADFALNFVCCEMSPIFIVQNDINAYELLIRSINKGENEAVKVVIAFCENTVTLIATKKGAYHVCTLPQLPEGAILIQIGRVSDDILHRIPEFIRGEVVKEYPNGEIPEPQTEEVDRLIVQLNDVAESADKSTANANQSAANADGSSELALEAASSANTSAQAAGSASQRADTAAQAANQARDNANQAAQAASSASQSANTAIAEIRQAAERGDFDGSDGLDGKSAYEAAIEGGFPVERTEGQFNSDLAVVHEKQDLFGEVLNNIHPSTQHVILPKATRFQVGNYGHLQISDSAVSLNTQNSAVSIFDSETMSEVGLFAKTCGMRLYDNSLILESSIKPKTLSVKMVSDGVDRYDAVNKGQLDAQAARITALEETLGALNEVLQFRLGGVL